jgi:hypothetical protein
MAAAKAEALAEARVEAMLAACQGLRALLFCCMQNMRGE